MTTTGAAATLHTVITLVYISFNVNLLLRLCAHTMGVLVSHVVVPLSMPGPGDSEITSFELLEFNLQSPARALKIEGVKSLQGRPLAREPIRGSRKGSHTGTAFSA
jgi:hypothetical protein